MNLNTKQILRLLPQRPPIVMVDAAQQDGDDCSAYLTITPDNWFVEDTHFLEAGIVEHQAQSVAVCLGLSQMAMSHNTRQMGFIAEVKNLCINRLPNVGETLVTAITYNTAVDSIILLQATTMCNNELIAESQLKIFLPS